MVAIKRYTDDYKKKVVDDYKKDGLSFTEVAAKYNLPPALLQDWINKDRLNDYVIKMVDRQEEKPSCITIFSGYVSKGFQILKGYKWQFVGCLPLLLFLFFFISFNKTIVDYENGQNRLSVQAKLDSLIGVNNELKKEINEINTSLDKIDEEVEMNNTILMLSTRVDSCRCKCRKDALR